MAHIFKYTILMAIPDRRRGERVNIGIMVFLRDRVDIRFVAVAKIGAIAGGNWAAYAGDLQRRILAQFKSGTEAEEYVAATPRIDPIIEASELGFFSIELAEQYETTVGEILDSLVVKPRSRPERPKSTRINTEIAREFRREKILATADEPIDARRVVRDLTVENELKADFAIRNSVMHITATLDLRRPRVDVKEATLKAIVLDRAREHFGDDTRRLGVYAAADIASDHFKTHIDLLKEYSDDCFNWENPIERRRYSSAILKAYGLDRLERFV